MIKGAGSGSVAGRALLDESNLGRIRAPRKRPVVVPSFVTSTVTGGAVLPS